MASLLKKKRKYDENKKYKVQYYVDILNGPDSCFRKPKLIQKKFHDDMEFFEEEYEYLKSLQYRLKWGCFSGSRKKTLENNKEKFFAMMKNEE